MSVPVRRLRVSSGRSGPPDIRQLRTVGHIESSYSSQPHRPGSDVEVEPHGHLALGRQSSCQVVLPSGQHLGSQLRLI